MTELVIGIALLLVVVWAALSLISVAFLLWPFGSRGGAARSLGFCLVAFLSLAVVLSFVQPENQPEVVAEGETGSDSETSTPTDSAALTAETQVGGEIPNACGDGGLVLGDVVAVNGDHVVHISPSATSPMLRNEKASRALGRPHFHRVDGSATVRRLCVQAEWTEVQIVTPDWLTHVKGWVPNRVLRTIERTAVGSRIYVEEDFYWDEDTAQFKAQIVATVNKITRENRNCGEIDTASIAKSPSRSEPGDPVFFVTCGTGSNMFNVWFRPGDAESDASFTAKQPIGESSAVDACELAAKGAAVHPSTVEFSRIWDMAYVPHISGRARVVSTFTAKNALNLELRYRIDCLFDGTELIEVTIAEALE